MLHPILILQFCQVALSSCFIYLSIIFHIEAFLNLNFFCAALMSHLFSWCTVFIFYLFCSLFTLHLFVLASLHIAPFLFCIYPPLGLFSCCNFFMLHFFHFGPSLLFCKKQNSFHGDLSLLLFLTMHTFHIALVHFMFHFFLVSYFSCCTLYTIPLHRA